MALAKDCRKGPAKDLGHEVLGGTYDYEDDVNVQSYCLSDQQ